MKKSYMEFNVGSFVLKLTESYVPWRSIIIITSARERFAGLSISNTCVYVFVMMMQDFEVAEASASD